MQLKSWQIICQLRKHLQKGIKGLDIVQCVKIFFIVDSQKFSGTGARAYLSDQNGASNFPHFLYSHYDNAATAS